jgi:hypothetical protein
VQGCFERNYEKNGGAGLISSLRIRELTEAEHPAWNALVGRSMLGTIYHDARWLGAVSRGVKQTFKLYGAFSGEKLVGGVPLQVRKKGPLSLARRAFATPYANFIVDDGANVSEDVLKKALAEIAALNSETMVTSSPFGGSTALDASWRKEERATYLIDIRDAGLVWSRFTHNLRRKIRKAERDGVRVEPECPFDAFFEIYRRTFERRGMTIPFTRERFAAMCGALVNAGIARLYAARTSSNEPCAAALILFDSRRAYYALSGTDVETTEMFASTLLMWNILQDLSRTRPEFDFVGANVAGVTRFKKQFSGVLTPYVEAWKYRGAVEKAAIRFYRGVSGLQGVIKTACAR